MPPTAHTKRPSIHKRGRGPKERVSAKKFVLIFLKIVYKPLITLICVIVFFTIYNATLVDHSLESLMISLESTTEATTLEEAQGLEFLIKFAMMREVVSAKDNSEMLANMEFVHNALHSATKADQLNDVNFVIRDMVKDKQSQRGVFLSFLDGINRRVAKGAQFVQNIPKFMAIAPQIATTTVDEELLRGAISYEEAGDFAKAAAVYEDLLERYPDYKNILLIKLRLGWGYQQLGRYDEAKRLFGEVVKTSFNASEVAAAQQLIGGIDELKSLVGKKEALLKRIEILTDKNEIQEAYFALGSLNGMLFDFIAAEEAFQKSADIIPGNMLSYRARFSIGWVYYKFRSKLEEAKAIFEEVARASPDENMAMACEYQVADILQKQGRSKEAAEHFRQISEKYGEEAIGTLSKFREGYAYLYDLNDPEAAKRVFDALREKEPSSNLAIHYEANVLPAMAKRSVLEGFEELEAGDYLGAIKTFNKAIELYKDYGRAHISLGVAYAELKRFDMAIAAAEEGIRLSPNDPYVLANFAYIHALNNQFDDALSYFKKALKQGGSPEFQATVYFNIGYIILIKGDLDSAMENYKKAIENKSDFTDAHVNLGFVYWQKGMYQEAIGSFEKATYMSKDSLEAHYNLGVGYLIIGEYEKAEREFIAAKEIMPNFKEIDTRLSEIARLKAKSR